VYLLETRLYFNGAEEGGREGGGGGRERRAISAKHTGNKHTQRGWLSRYFCLEERRSNLARWD